MQLLLFFNIWSFPYVFLLKYHPLDQFYAGTSIALILTFILGVELASKFIDKRFFLVILVLLVSGMALETYQRISIRDRVFYHTVQKLMTYGDQKRMIEKMILQKRTFEWEAFTVPYYLSDAYQYLLPWHGRQVLGDKIDSLLSSEKKTDYYLMIEPETGGDWLRKWLLEKDAVSKLVSEESFGGMTLQLRKKNN